MPMVRTLEALEDMAAGDVLTIHNDRVPLYLLPQLEELGADYQVQPLTDGSARVRIVKRGMGAERGGAAP